MWAQSKKDFENLEKQGLKTMVLETYGGMPFLSVAQLSQRWDLPPSAVRRYAGEIEDIIAGVSYPHLKSRYPVGSVIGERKNRRINEFVFADWLGFRHLLKDKLKAKLVEPFSISRYAMLMQFYNRPLREWTDEDAANFFPEKLKKQKKDKRNTAGSGIDKKRLAEAFKTIQEVLEQGA